MKDMKRSIVLFILDKILFGWKLEIKALERALVYIDFSHVDWEELFERLTDASEMHDKVSQCICHAKKYGEYTYISFPRNKFASLLHGRFKKLRLWHNGDNSVYGCLAI